MYICVSSSAKIQSFFIEATFTFIPFSLNHTTEKLIELLYHNKSSYRHQVIRSIYLCFNDYTKYNFHLPITFEHHKPALLSFFFPVYLLKMMKKAQLLKYYNVFSAYIWDFSIKFAREYRIHIKTTEINTEFPLP